MVRRDAQTVPVGGGQPLHDSGHNAVRYGFADRSVRVRFAPVPEGAGVVGQVQGGTGTARISGEMKRVIEIETCLP